MQTNTALTADKVLDVRAIPSAVRHAAVQGALGAIPVSGSLTLAAVVLAVVLAA